MWHPLVIKRDKQGFLNFAERPLAEHLADSLNELEAKEGRVTGHITITDTENLLEIVVRTEKEE